jgi:hypothetical protein
VGDFEQSSLTQRAFCEARSLEWGTFRYWLYQVRREATGHQSVRFVPLVASEAASQSSCRVRCGDVELSFADLPEPGYLAELLRLMDR